MVICCCRLCCSVEQGNCNCEYGQDPAFDYCHAGGCLPGFSHPDGVHQWPQPALAPCLLQAEKVKSENHASSPHSPKSSTRQSLSRFLFECIFTLSLIQTSIMRKISSAARQTVDSCLLCEQCMLRWLPASCVKQLQSVNIHVLSWLRIINEPEELNNTIDAEFETCIQQVHLRSVF